METYLEARFIASDGQSVCGFFCASPSSSTDFFSHFSVNCDEIDGVSIYTHSMTIIFLHSFGLGHWEELWEFMV